MSSFPNNFLSTPRLLGGFQFSSLIREGSKVFESRRFRKSLRFLCLPWQVVISLSISCGAVPHIISKSKGKNLHLSSTVCAIIIIITTNTSSKSHRRARANVVSAVRQSVRIQFISSSQTLTIVVTNISSTPC